MPKWKLCRQRFGDEEFILKECEKVTVGRGNMNKIILTGHAISRNHCIIEVNEDNVFITDLKSSNGTFIGLKKIPQETPTPLVDGSIIGLGVHLGSQIKDEEKFIFKLTKINSIVSRIQFQNETDLEDIEAQLADVIGFELPNPERRNIPPSPIINTNPKLKRKLETLSENNTIKKEIKTIKDNESVVIVDDDGVVCVADNESDTNNKNENMKKIKLEPVTKETSNDINKVEQIKTESNEIEYEAFSVKQEYLGYDNELIEIDDDSDSEAEQWQMRLSQGSPGKPFMTIPKIKVDDRPENCSYSQTDDSIVDSLLNHDYDDEECLQDLITILPEKINFSLQYEHATLHSESVSNHLNDNKISLNNRTTAKDEEKFEDDIIKYIQPSAVTLPVTQMKNASTDYVDGMNFDELSKLTDNNSVAVSAPQLQNKTVKKTQVIEPPSLHVTRRKSSRSEKSKSKNYSSRHIKAKKHTSSKIQITNSQKEERKNKLKEIALKGKDECEKKMNKNSSCESTKQKINVKVTTSNRGAFLTDVDQAVVKHLKMRENSQESDTQKEGISKTAQKHLQPDKVEDIENKKNDNDAVDKHKTSREKDKQKNTTSKSAHVKLQKPQTTTDHDVDTESQLPLESIKPLQRKNENLPNKLVTKVIPLSKPPKKQVRFSDKGPDVYEFVIEPGNRMKNISLIKASLADTRHVPRFSLQKITLMKILKWNPQWFDEQINNKDPPPILGNNNTPMGIFHSFQNHRQYIRQFGDLLLMEIWGSLTFSYMKIRGQNTGLEMRLESLPPVPTQEPYFDLFNLSVNISVPKADTRSVPRAGEVMLVKFGQDGAMTSRFFFVHNVRCLPSPSNNIHAFYSISLHATFTDKMKSLRPGEVLFGTTLAYINNELGLFEAMEYLRDSPLSETILQPEPRHFPKTDPSLIQEIKQSQWCTTLNESQLRAVATILSATFGDQPCIQMIQGPPGTGKSSVICSIVMTYFYDSNNRKNQKRGKILICATSNAAVDEIVLRLLKIRQTLPKCERFRMVRVGRTEAMHPQAHNVSSQHLVTRQPERGADTNLAHPGLAEEIAHLQAKVNMWRTAMMEAKDAVRVAYCEGQVKHYGERMALFRTGAVAGAEPSGNRLIASERRLIEGADIVATTLASAHNIKMKGLKRRIALCIVDEAGQAIEPQTLIPLTLDVTRLALVGDPQQLPGYICSQRAKKHGLGDSLFSRLTSCTESWLQESPVVLLNQQYRMHPAIADYPNRAFYDRRICSMPTIRTDLDIMPYCVLTVSSGDKGQGLCGGNEMEAWAVARLAAALSARLRGRHLSLAVITPYNAHKDLIRRNLYTIHQQLETSVEVNTVDSFQGQERDVVVVSLARSHGVGFLTDAGRMNVMLTRARHALVLVLNPHATLENHQWRTLVQDAQKRRLYRMLPTLQCQPVAPGQPPDEHILYYIQDTPSAVP